jgi:enterochelin esterase-like enzyme
MHNKVLDTQILPQELNYGVLLPKNYYETTDSFPVVYLLHGYGDNYKAWFNGGSIGFFADKFSAEIQPMIFVTMDGYKSYYVNKYSGSFPYMDMVIDELVSEIDLHFKTKKQPSQRAVMGYSMGGYGAMILPLLNPDVFGISVVLSMSFRTDAQYMAESSSGWDYQWGSIFGGAGEMGENRLTEYYKEHNPFYIFDRPVPGEIKNIKYFMTCGDDEESLHIPAGELHNLMRKQEIEHEFRVDDGGHSWEYWHSSMEEALKFINYGFEGMDYPDEVPPIIKINDLDSDQVIRFTPDNLSFPVQLFKPVGYDNSTTSYPLICMIFDNGDAGEAENSDQVFSLLNDQMIKGSIPNSLILLIPAGKGDVTSENMIAILNEVKHKVRFSEDRNQSILVANGKGGQRVPEILPGCSTIFNACFLYNADIPKELSAIDNMFYYIDITDEALAYEENFNFFLTLRGNGNENEYRVRQGTESFQSVLNGIYSSRRFLFKRLTI